MCKNRFSEEQIIRVLDEVQGGQRSGIVLNLLDHVLDLLWVGARIEVAPAG